MKVAAAAACIFCLAVASYMLSFSGVPISDDEELYASAARNLAVMGKLSAEQLTGNLRLAGSYHGVEPAFPAVLSVWYRLLLHAPFGHLQTLYLLPIVWTALSGALIVVIAAQLSYDCAIGVVAAILFVFSSMAWPYAKTLFREPLISLLLLGSLSIFLRLTQAERHNGPRALLAVLLLLLLALLTLTRVVMVAPAAVLLISLLGRSVPPWPKMRLALLSAGVIVLLLGIGMVLSAPRATDADVFYRFTGGFVQDAVHRLASIPHSHLLEALTAPLVSPWKGLLIYSPICLVGLISLVLNVRRLAILALLTLTALCALLIVQALAYDAEWWTPTWGSRFLLPVVPLLVVAALPVLDRLMKRGRAGWLAIAALFVIGVVIQLPALLFNSAEFTAASYQDSAATFPQGVIWNVGKAPLFAQWRAAAIQEPDLLLWRTAVSHPVITGLVCSLCAGVIVLSLAALWRVLTGIEQGPRVLVASSLVLVVMATGAFLKAVTYDPVYEMNEFKPLCAFIQRHVDGTDAVIVQPYPGPVWQYLANEECGQQAWYSLPYHAKSGAAELITHKIPVGGRYWLIQQFWGKSFASTDSVIPESDVLLSEDYLYSPYQLFIAAYSRGQAK